MKRKISFYFLLAVFSFLISALPAQAGRLLQWRFDVRSSQLEFSTEDGVQPRAQFITNPGRLVIDLPGTVFGRKQLIEPVTGQQGVQSLRVGQFDPQTARIVLELVPGYSIDPTQVIFEGVSPRQWRVKLPPVKFVGTEASNTINLPPTQSSPPSQSPLPSIARTQVQSVRITGDGFYLRTTGTPPLPQVTRSNDRRQVYVDLPATSLSPSLSPRDLIVNQRGVSRAQITQLSGNPPIARLVLNVQPDGADWQASYSNLGGVVVIPKLPDSGQIGTNNPRPRDEAQEPRSTSLTTIQAVDLEGDRIVVRANQRLTYTGTWDRLTGAYRILIPSSQFDRNVRGPQLTASSPVMQIKLRQDNAQTSSILVTPAAGIQIGELNQPNAQTVTLQLRRGLSTVPPMPSNPGTQIPVPPPKQVPTPTIPRVPAGQVVVVIDPGHGGPDPGAVGIGGIQEKEIVLDIGRQVAGILQQQGVSAVLTRQDDIDLDLQPRVDIAEQVRATVFVSIHANAISMSRPDISGLETYYYDSGLGLAQSIHRSVMDATGVRDRGVRKARFYVIRKTTMPSVLVETGFVTGQEDASRLATPGYRRQMAEGIARGILLYIRGGG
ncbi:MAG: hypothetical protein B0A82_23570 [Alkalinema sp. CACIAM 70d]|nr:MAG: hypothetical protein B0A82_23570 [Alkalinema sp. CACIAM 70d]